MKDFFNVRDITHMLAYLPRFSTVATEDVPLADALGRVAAITITADANLPGFYRSTMDGYAVCAAATFGAGEANPACLNIVGSIAMGQAPDFGIGTGQAARIATGGMLPAGADSVVMLEHTDMLDATTLEVYRSVAPGQFVVGPDEDFAAGAVLVPCGAIMRPQEIGLLAAFGHSRLKMYCRPRIGIISTGDEVVPVTTRPLPGQIRDINSYTLAAMVTQSGAVPAVYGIVQDHSESLRNACRQALAETDMVLVSGGSSVGTRDFTLEVFESLSATTILAHGVAISPGKPTLLADSTGKALWGLPGHVVSAMIVFGRVVRPFIVGISGQTPKVQADVRPVAQLTRNVPSVLGRVDYIRVRLFEENDILWAEPLPGKSGLINTMVQADGLIEIGRDVEGLTRGTRVKVFSI